MYSYNMTHCVHYNRDLIRKWEVEVEYQSTKPCGPTCSLLDAGHVHDYLASAKRYYVLRSINSATEDDTAKCSAPLQ